MLRRRLLARPVAMLLAACMQEADPATDGGTTSAPPTETGAADDAFTPKPIEWDDCGGVECATLEVPLDYDDPAGEQIELYVARTPAGGDRKGALFINPGGPGAGAAEYAELLPYVLPDEITEHFDIVGLDPRGVGGSTAITCGIPDEELYGVDPTFEDAADREAYLEVSDAYVEDCADKYGDVLQHVGTPAVARDMDVVRAAMGDEQLSFLGFSYGTVIGQVYADLFPERVRSMVLDGVLELGPTGLESADTQADGFELALDRFVEYCDAAERCATAGDTLAAVEEVLALAEEPGGIPAEDADRAAGPGEADRGISYGLYAQQLWLDLANALSDARDGDGSGLVELADGYLDLGSFELYFGVNCLDFAWPTGDPDAFFTAAKATAEHAPHFGEALVNDYVRCASWPAPPVPLEPVTAPGAPPILVISTTGDPATPYEGGVAVAETLATGVLVTNEGDGHTVVGNGKDCIDDLVAAYLVDDVVPEDGYTCE
ncbi:MAG: alpha/beta hydrolase [Acidimicrobiales bacterium]